MKIKPSTYHTLKAETKPLDTECDDAGPAPAEIIQLFSIAQAAEIDARLCAVANTEDGL